MNDLFKPLHKPLYMLNVGHCLAATATPLRLPIPIPVTTMIAVAIVIPVIV
jgi:hypothetical protein